VILTHWAAGRWAVLLASGCSFTRQFSCLRDSKNGVLWERGKTLAGFVFLLFSVLFIIGRIQSKPLDDALLRVLVARYSCLFCLRIKILPATVTISSNATNLCICFLLWITIFSVTFFMLIKTISLSSNVICSKDKVFPLTGFLPRNRNVCNRTARF